MSICDEIRARLFKVGDKGYRDFHSRLIPNVSPDTIIGVRTPALRKLAAEYKKDPRISEFLSDIPHGYYEETNLHGFIVCTVKDYDRCVSELDRLLPFIDNWASCDLLKPVCFKKEKARLIADITRWIGCEHIYTRRFGIGMLMCHFLDEAFSPEYLKLAVTDSDEYYISMMTAWFFATALAKQYDAALPYIEQHTLDKQTHNRAIQKALESYRISPEQKTFLRSLKVK